MERRIVGIARDDGGARLAVLACHHRVAEGRAADRDDDAILVVGAVVDCAACDRAEVPAGLVVVRTTPHWDEQSMPGALRRAHRVASGVWGRLRVEEGGLRFVARTTPPLDVLVGPGDAQGIPPDVEHHVEPQGSVRFAVEFLAPPS